MRIFYRLLLMIMMFALTGCGFHLRGVFDADSLKWLNSVAIVIQKAHKDLEPLLKSQLIAYDISVTTDPALAEYWLIVDNETITQNITSISSSTTARQYEITYTVSFKLQRAKGAEVIPFNKIVITRQITLNSNRILGSSDEEELQKNEMRRDAAMQIIYRLTLADPKPHSKTSKAALSRR